MLKDQARPRVPGTRRRSRSSARCGTAANATAFDKATWASIGEMGWAGIVVPEAYGGVDMGYLTFGVVLEELGRQLTASPLSHRDWSAPARSCSAAPKTRRRRGCRASSREARS